MALTGDVSAQTHAQARLGRPLHKLPRMSAHGPQFVIKLNTLLLRTVQERANINDIHLYFRSGYIVDLSRCVGREVSKSTLIQRL